MAATKITSAIKASAGSSLFNAATYNALPASAAEGALARVTTTNAAGVYAYAANIDGYPVGKWVPVGLYDKGLTYFEDVSNNPARASMKAGGDTKAILDARGWAAGALGTGTVTDGTDAIVISAHTTSDNYASYGFAPVFPAQGMSFMILEVDVTSQSAANNNSEALAVIQDGVRRHLLTLVADNTTNNAAFSQDNSSVEVGAGKFTFTSRETIFAVMDIGFGVSRAWTANTGYDTSAAIGSTVAGNSDLPGTGGSSLGMWAQLKTSAATVTTEYQEYHLFKVG